MRVLYALFFTVITFPLFGQGFKMNYSNSIADCSGAIEVYDYDYPSTIQFPGNSGGHEDFTNLNPNNREVNSIWVRLEPRLKGKFKLEIISAELTNDMSYFIFRANENDFCEEFNENYIKPEMHVLSHGSSFGTVSSDSDDSYKPEINVDFQDVLYVLVHTTTKGNSSVILRYNLDGQVEETKANIQDYRSDDSSPFLHVKIRDKATGEPVEANLAINGINNEYAAYLGTDFFFDKTKTGEIYVESNTKGYFVFSQTYQEDELEEDLILVELVKLAPGIKLELQDIKFEVASDAFLPIALPALKRLLDFMALNESVRIELQGHVNSPDSKNTFATKRLSKMRCKAVYKFLKKNGIDGDRMQIKGFGNTRMIYEDPKNEEEAEANRRVEILILAN